VRAISKQPNGLLWGKFTEEAWRKTVVRRGIKSVPCSEKLRAAVERHDEMFDLEARDVTPAAPRLPPVKGPTLMVVWQPGEPVDVVPVRDFAARTRALIGAAAPGEVEAWMERNRQALREYWALDRDSALVLKAEIERATTRQEKPPEDPPRAEPPPPADDDAPMALFPDEPATEPDDRETLIRDAIAEGSREKSPAKRRAILDALPLDQMTDEQVGRLRAAFEQMDQMAGKPARARAAA
jgi:hypothetical protein